LSDTEPFPLLMLNYWWGVFYDPERKVQGLCFIGTNEVVEYQLPLWLTNRIVRALRI
jgi:hypothetical protein